MKYKEFKSPTDQPTRVSSEDYRVDWVYPEWTMLQERFWKSAYSEGCISKDMNRVGINPMEAIANLEAQEKAFEEQVYKTMQEILEEGDLEKIDASGKPKVSAIGEVIGMVPEATLRNRLFKRLINDRK